MQAREIPQSAWRDFLDNLSTLHEDWITTIQNGDRVEARELPLVGIGFDEKGSGSREIEIEVGGDPSDQLTHIIEGPHRLLFSQTEDESRLELEIDAAHGQKTVVRLRRATRDELPEKPKRDRARRAAE